MNYYIKLLKYYPKKFAIKANKRFLLNLKAKDNGARGPC